MVTVYFVSLQRSVIRNIPVSSSGIPYETAMAFLGFSRGPNHAVAVHERAIVAPCVLDG